MRLEGDMDSQESGLSIKELLLAKREEILRTARFAESGMRIFLHICKESRSGTMRQRCSVICRTPA
jgi:hypothetical protein